MENSMDVTFSLSLDHKSVTAFKEQIDTIVKSTHDIEIDMSAVKRLDSAWLGMLAAVVHKNPTKHFTFVNVNEYVGKMLEIVKLGENIKRIKNEGISY